MIRKEYSNGWGLHDWNGKRLHVDERWHSRFLANPPDYIAYDLKKSLDWAYDDWFCFEGKVLVKAYAVQAWQAKKYYEMEDGFCMIQGVYVHPESRQQGHCKRFLQHAMEIADKREGYITAVCRPFHHETEETDEEIPNIEQIARDFANSQSAMRYSSVKEKEGKTRQQRMASTLIGLGWDSVNLSANMDYPELFGEFAFIY